MEAARWLEAAKTGDVETLVAMASAEAKWLAFRGEGTPDGVVGNTALHAACARGHAAAVTALLAAKADLNLRNHGDSTPLHSAALHNQGDCARALLLAGADPNLADEYGDTPLGLAERAGFDELATVLRLSRNSETPIAAPTAREGRQEGGASPMVDDDHKRVGNDCFRAGDYEAAVEAYTLGMADGPDATMLSNRSAAYAKLGLWANAERDARAAIDLSKGWSRAHSRLACALQAQGRLREARHAFLTAVGLEPASVELQGALQEVESALRTQKLEDILSRKSTETTATSLGREDAATAHAPEDVATAPASAEQRAYAERVRAWQAAAKTGDVAALHAQLSAHPDLLHNRSEHTAEKLLGNTALHWACAGGHATAVAALLEARADPRGRNNGGSTPLHTAASHNRVEVVELLLAAGADPSLEDVRTMAGAACAHGRPLTLASAPVPRTLRTPHGTRRTAEASASPPAFLIAALRSLHGGGSCGRGRWMQTRRALLGTGHTRAVAGASVLPSRTTRMPSSAPAGRRPGDGQRATSHPLPRPATGAGADLT